MRTPRPARSGQLTAARFLIERPQARWWAFATVLNRLVPAMGVVGLILAGEEATGSLADGALLLALSAAGFALSAPWRGRALDRRELRGGLQRDCLLAAASVAALAVSVAVSAPLWLLASLAALTGVATAGLEGGFRALLTVVVSERDLPRASAFEAVLGETSFLIGPALAGLVAYLTSPVVVVWSMAVAALGAALATTRLPHRHPTSLDAPDGGDDNVRALAGVWRMREVRPVFLLALAAGVTVGLFESAMPARVQDLGMPSAAGGGYITAAYTGSLVGGLIATARASGRPDEHATRAAWHASALFAWLGLGFAALAVAPTATVLGVAGVAGGAALAPLYALGAIVIQARTPQARHAEAFSVFIAAQALGGGLGNSVTSQLLELLGGAGLLGLAAGVSVAMGGLVATHRGVAAARRR